MKLFLKVLKVSFLTLITITGLYLLVSYLTLQVAKYFFPRIARMGFVGIERKIDELKDRGFWKYIYVFDKKHFGFVKFLGVCAKSEKQIPQRGLPKTAVEFLDQIGIEYQLTGSDKNYFQKHEGSVILLGLNHEFFAEPIILTAAGGRKDLYFFGIKTIAYTGKNFAKFVLPVLPRKYAAGRGALLFRKKPKDSIDIFADFLNLERFNAEEIDKLNNDSINKAANVLAEGHALMIFPNGGRVVTHPWMRGIGEIIKVLREKNYDKTIILPSQFLGLSSKKRVILAARKRLLGGPVTLRVKIKVGKPIAVGDLFREIDKEKFTDGRSIAAYLRQKILREMV